MNIAALIGAITFLPSLGLNIALALGAPLGVYAMNAKYTVIPKELRPAFVMPIVMQFAALWFILTGGEVLPDGASHLIPGVITTIFAFFFALYMTFYTATLLFSSSYKEKTVMGSFGAITTVCYWITAISTVVE
ncbi:MAG: hypothetical protein MJY87_05430 [Fibrobacter sp.]|nr:hypothetical protein [Fibrobacter sp.]